MEEIYNRKEFLRRGLAIATGICVVSPLEAMASAILNIKPDKRKKTNYQAYDFSNDTDEEIATRILLGELGGLIGLNEREELELALEGEEIVRTIKKRAESGIDWYGSSIREAALKVNPRRDRHGNLIKDLNGNIILVHQYSCLNAWDPNLERIREPEKFYGKENVKRALRIAENTLKEETKKDDPTHYHIDGLEAYWAKDPRYRKLLRPDFFKHDFYTDTKAA